jgi:glycosyltransferase involved in cell wall biosynthesis
VTVGFHSPLPPAASGVADYSAALLEQLREHLDVAINPINPANVELYHLGNNELHRPIYKRLMQDPGVVVLHDAVLHHFFLGAMPEDLYVAEFVYNYGEWGRDLALDLWRNRARSGQDPRYFRYPMLRRVGEVARAVIVHNPAAARMVREHAPEAAVVEIPHLFDRSAPPDPVDVTRLRARLGVGTHGVVFGVFGYLRESKRLYSTLRAFEAVRALVPEAALLIAGRFASSDLERGVAPLLDAPGVHRTGFLDEAEFGLYSAATDVCVNLRYPPAGETSGIGIRMMGLGKPTVVTAGEEVSRFPEKACVRVDSGPGEREMLAHYLVWLAGDPGARRTMGREAEWYVAREHGIEKCAARYVEVLGSVPQRRTKRQRSLGAH